MNGMTYKHFKELIEILEQENLYAIIGKLLDRYPIYAERLLNKPKEAIYEKTD